MKNKEIIFSIFAAIIILTIGLFISFKKPSEKKEGNVSMENGTQIVKILVKGGYAPHTSIAKAGIPTIIRMETDNTYDCSLTVSIPQLDIRKTLPYTGVENIPIPAEKAKGVLRGVCSMGMYSFLLQFE